MLNTLIKLFAFSLLVLVVFSPIFSQDISETKFTKLTVNISNIQNDSGFVRVHLYNSKLKDNFPKRTLFCYRKDVIRINSGKATAVFNLPAGDIYCLSVHHDENSNEEMDMNFIGLPVEGWGISNNIKLFMRLPKFDECSFNISDKDTNIFVNMRY